MACKGHGHGATTHAACVLPPAQGGSGSEDDEKEGTAAAPRVATGASDGTVCVWDTQTGHCLWREVIASRDSGVGDLSPDVRALLPLSPTRLAAACWDGRLFWLTVCHHDPGDGGAAAGGGGGSQSSVVACQSGPLWCLAALPTHQHDGATTPAVLASGGSDGVVRLWVCPTHEGDAAPVAPCLELHGHSEDVTCVSATSLPGDGDAMLASGSTDGWVRLWRVGSTHGKHPHHLAPGDHGWGEMHGACLRQLRGGGDRLGGRSWAPLSVTGVTWIDIGTGQAPRLVSGTSEGTLVVWGALESLAPGGDDAAPSTAAAPQSNSSNNAAKNPLDMFAPLLFAPLRAALGAIPGVDGDALPLPHGDGARLAHVASTCDMSRGRQTLRLSGSATSSPMSAPDAHSLPQQLGGSSSECGVPGVTSLSVLPRHLDTLCCGDGAGTVRLWRALPAADGALRLEKVCTIGGASPKGAAGGVAPLSRHRIAVAGGSQLRVWQLVDGQDSCTTGHSFWTCDDV